MKIRIENPTPGGAQFTSRRQADEYVRQGRARLSADGRQLRFLEAHHAHRSTELTAQELADQAWRFTDRGYDARGLLTERELRRIPIVMAFKLLYA